MTPLPRISCKLYLARTSRFEDAFLCLDRSGLFTLPPFIFKGLAAGITSIKTWVSEDMDEDYLLDFEPYTEPDRFFLDKFSLRVDNLSEFKRSALMLPEAFDSDISAELEVSISDEACLAVVATMLEGNHHFRESTVAYVGQETGFWLDYDELPTAEQGFDFLKRIQREYKNGVEVIQVIGPSGPADLAWINLSTGDLVVHGQTDLELEDDGHIEILFPELADREFDITLRRGCNECCCAVRATEKGVSLDENGTPRSFFRAKMTRLPDFVWAKGWWAYLGKPM